MCPYNPMADQQNAIQNDNLLGDIDLSGTTSDSTAGVSTSTSSAAATTSQISDLGDVLVDQSIDNMQSKAENTEDFTPTPDAISPITVETPASVPTDLNAIFSIEKSEPTAPVVALSPSYDPANIDLGDISLDPSGGESMPKSMNSNADIASDEIKPTGMFSARP